MIKLENSEFTLMILFYVFLPFRTTRENIFEVLNSVVRHLLCKCRQSYIALCVGFGVTEVGTTMVGEFLD